MLTPRKLDGIISNTDKPNHEETPRNSQPCFSNPEKDPTDPFTNAEKSSLTEPSNKPIDASEANPPPSHLTKPNQDATPSETVKLKGLDKKFDKDIFFLKQSYRSLFGLLFLIFSGLMFAMFSDLFAKLMIPPEDLAKGPDFLKGETIPYILKLCGILLMLVGVFKVCIARLSSKYEIQRLCIKTHKGIIAKKRATIQYADVRAAQTNKTVIGAILNFGDIEFFTAGSDGSEIILKGVYSPDRVAEHIDIRINKAKQAIKEGTSTISV